MTRCMDGLMAGLLVAMVAGCTALDDPTDYNRHRLTEITIPRDRTDIFFYDVTTDAAFPPDDPSAEAARMHWLDLWMNVRAMCPGGHEVVKRRPFDFLEDNPAHHDLRYEVRCKPMPLPEKKS